MAEANAANLRAQARKEKAEPQLVFCQELAQKMLTNNLDDNGTTVTQIGCTRTHGSLERVHMDYKLTKWPLSTRAWDAAFELGLPPGMSTKKQTAPLLDAEISAELVVPVIRKSPCVKLVTISILPT